MKKNLKILHKALDRLPVYSPVETQWTRLETSLDNLSDGNPVKKLGQFEPPETVWQQIEEKLVRRTRFSRTRLIAKWSSAAAAVLALGFIIFNTLISQKTDLTFSEEYLPGRNTVSWQNDDAVITRAIEQICASKPDICLSEDFKTLEKELEFLNKSKQTILNQMNPYESRIELEQLITKIELEQTAIINQLVDIIN